MALLSGCAGGRELETTLLVRAVGADRTAGGGLILTAVGKTDEDPVRGMGEDWSAAVEALATAGERYVTCTHMTELVIGAGVDVEQLLEEAVEHWETGYLATVWLADGAAGELLADGGAADRLDALREAGEVEAVNVLDALVELKREGEVDLPLLTARDGAIGLAGYGTVEEGYGEE